MWPVPPRDLELVSGEVHCFLGPLDAVPEARLAALRGVLDDAERARADRFYFERHRRQFIVARGGLRRLLGHYLGVDPRAITFAYAQHGKPELGPGMPEAANLRFNLSHSGQRVLYALARGRELGVDIEHKRRLIDGERIARRFFSARENAAFTELATEDRRDAFFRCWTRKEAFIKALGDGLTLPLDRFDVTLAPGAPARLLATRPDPAAAERWSMAELDPGDDYCAALVTEGEASGMRCFAFPEWWG